MTNHIINNMINSKQWDRLYQLLDPSSKSPFFSSEYYRSYTEVEGGKPLCFTMYKDDDNFLFYPFIKKSINEIGYQLDDDYYDIIGAYGYNGPIGKTSDSGFIRSFNAELQEYLSQKKIVTEFVRYCPIVGNRRFHDYTNQIDVLDNVYINLADGLDSVWEKSFASRVRRSIRKGASYNLKTNFFRGNEITKENIKTFFDIYNETMKRTKADEFYYFDFEFFMKLVENLNKTILLSITYFEDTPISTELILMDGELAFGFLGGTLSEYYQYKANTFQRWELLKYLDIIGVKKYSMGGGAIRGDGIYKFKLSFARECENPFYIGIHVHKEDIYQEIKKQWKEKHPKAAERYGHLLLGYRHLDR